MKKIFISIIFLFVLSDLLFAQDTITLYYNSNWVEISNKDEATYYRKAFEDTNKVWNVRDYYISNKIQMTGAFKSKKLISRQGHFIYYHENGKKSSEGNYINNRAEGFWNYWHENGQKKSSGEYLAGKKEGAWEYWYEDGSKKSEGKYLKDESVDVWNYWYQSGQLKSKETYKKDGLFTYEGYYENGAARVKGNIVNGKPQGTWVYWNSDGRITMKGDFNHGLKDGEWIRFFPYSEMNLLFKNGAYEGKQFGGIVRTE
jgi:Uncharacterized protein conserved in bacteria